MNRTYRVGGGGGIRQGYQAGNQAGVSGAVHQAKSGGLGPVGCAPGAAWRPPNGLAAPPFGGAGGMGRPPAQQGTQMAALAAAAAPGRSLGAPARGWCPSGAAS